jgi:hypothetical protein
MKLNIEALKDFLDDHGTCYQNSNNIDFDRMDDCIMVSYTDCHRSDHKHVDFFLSYEKNFQRFMIDYSIKEPKDFDKVTPGQLWNLFRQGKGKIYCGLDCGLIYFSLYFRYEDQKLFATGEHDVKQEVIESLQSVEDFTNYTYRIFQNSSSSSHNSSCMPQSPL